EDIEHEIQERVTAADHQELTNALNTSLRTQVEAGRAHIVSSTEVSESFVTLWQTHKVRVEGLRNDGSSNPLSIEDSHRRTIAWVVPPPPDQIEPNQPDERTMSRLNAEFAVAQTSIVPFDSDLLLQLIKSRGRAWIECPMHGKALELLERARSIATSGTELWLWSHYLISIAPLLADGITEGRPFSEDFQRIAQPFGLDRLFAAEEIQFLRKQGDIIGALKALNRLLPTIESVAGPTTTERYVWGTTLFLLSNMLRFGGRYFEAASL